MGGGASAAQITTVHDVMHNLEDMPVAYSFLEQATQRKDGVSRQERAQGNARIFSGLSQVAAAAEGGNASESWFPTARSSAEIATVTPDGNRQVTSAYAKLCCAIIMLRNFPMSVFSVI
jgi:hypothetical protein